MIANQAIWHNKEKTNYWLNFYAQNELINGAIQRSFEMKWIGEKIISHNDSSSLSYCADERCGD